MYRWLVLLRGQGIELPFRHIFGSFLIGRFIGTFLPSTAGLDGYKLYDAARFSGKTVEVTATTAIEKVMGIFGIFLSFLVALPFGIKIFGANGPMVAAITVPISLGLIGALLAVLWFPGLVQWLLLRAADPRQGAPRRHRDARRALGVGVSRQEAARAAGARRSRSSSTSRPRRCTTSPPSRSARDERRVLADRRSARRSRSSRPW